MRKGSKDDASTPRHGVRRDLRSPGRPAGYADQPRTHPRIGSAVGGQAERDFPPALVRTAEANPAATSGQGGTTNALSVGAPAPGSGAQPAQTPPGTAPAQPANGPASLATPAAPGPTEGQAAAGWAKAPPLPAQPSAAYRAPYPGQPPPTGYPSTLVGPTAPPGPRAPAVGGPETAVAEPGLTAAAGFLEIIT